MRCGFWWKIGRIGRSPFKSLHAASALLAARLVERLDALEPAGMLAVVDLTQVQHVPIHDPSALDSPLLGSAPVPMLFSVFHAPMALQIHDPSAAASSHARHTKICPTVSVIPPL